MSPPLSSVLVRPDCSHHFRRQQEAGGATGRTGSGGIAFHLLADQYPDLLDWVFNEARLKIMEVRGVAVG